MEAIEALADATRRSVFERLREGPHSVGELASGMPVSRPAVSQHLRVLKSAGLVRDRQAGNRRIYEVAPDGLRALQRYLDDFWAEAMRSYKRAADSQTPERKDR